MRLAVVFLALVGCSKSPEAPARSPVTSSGTGAGVAAGTPSGTPGGTPEPIEVFKFDGEVPKNLIFLSFDTLRRDHIGIHGTKGLTPFFDEIAAEGVVMQDHIQCSTWTYASTTCTLAGRTSVDRGHMPRLAGPQAINEPVPAGTEFLATWLTQNGFYTQISNPNAWMSATWGNTQGYISEELEGGNYLFQMDNAMDTLLPVLDGGEYERWFMHIHASEPHAAYNPPEEFVVGQDLLEPWPGGDLRDRQLHYSERNQHATMSPEMQDLLEAHLRVLYEGEVRVLDDRLRQNWERLESEGLLDDALVVLWTDHGEEFWEHGYQTHAYDLTFEQNDGLLIFWAANLEPGTWDQTTYTTDIVPTLLKMYDIPIPEVVTGVPIGEAPSDRAIFTEVAARSGAAQAVIQEGWKLHYNWDDGRVRLWDRNTDRTEQVDLYDPNHPRVGMLWDLLQPEIQRMIPSILGGDIQPTPPADLPWDVQ